MEFINRVFASVSAITQEDLEPYKVPIGIAVLLLAAGCFGLWLYWEKRHRAALADQAKALGLQFSAEPDYNLAAQVQFLNYLGRGTDRYAFNIMQGIYRGRPVRCFDYHFATGTKDRTSHYFSVYILYHPAEFPRIEISPKSFLHRMDRALGLGMESLHFESVAFTKAFAVNSNGRAFAHAVCHPRMMEFLMQHQNLNIEFEGNCIAICYMSRLKPKRVQPHLDILTGISELIPRHLYADEAPRTGGHVGRTGVRR